MLESRCIYVFYAFIIVNFLIIQWNLKVVGLNNGTYSSILLDDRSVPFLFTLPKYDVLLIDDSQTQKYVIPQQPHMGVAEPFSGNPSGDVVFNIINETTNEKTFYSLTKKIGNFFFLELFVFNDVNVNRKKRYHLHIEALFTSHTGFIKLKNDTEVIVHLVDRNENCPFFSSNLYTFNIYENITIHTAVGKVYAVDDDSGLNSQIYFYLDPTNSEIPFLIDSRSGVIYTTRSFRSYYFQDYLNPDFSRNNFNYVNKQVFNFKIYATHRGLKSHVHCNIASFTEVNVFILPEKPYLLDVQFEPMKNIPEPAKAGVVYGKFFVNNVFSSNYTTVSLRILEPDIADKFSLIRIFNSSQWILVTMYDLSSIYLNSTIRFTLDAVQTIYTDTDKHWNHKNVILSQYQKSINIPLIPNSKYRLFFPPIIYVNVSEAAIVNSTFEILRPVVSYNLTDASFVYKTLNNVNDDRLQTKVKLTTSGALLVATDLNLEIGYQSLFEISDPIIIPIVVVDINNPSLSGAARSQIIVRIEDINDNNPIVVNNGSIYEIRENAALGTPVFKINAYDPDLSNTSLSYIIYDSEFMPFNLSGFYHDTLIVSKPLDAETMPSEFTVYVRVSDSGFPLPRSVLSIFTVRILDVNEHFPQFVERSCETWLTVSDEGAIIPSLDPKNPVFYLGRFTAEDVDRDGQNMVTIRLAAQSLSRPCFNVDQQTGNLTITCSYLDPPGSKIFISLIASDGVNNSKEPFIMYLNLISIHDVGEANFTKNCNSSGVYETLQKLRLRRREYDILMNDKNFYDGNINDHMPQFPNDLPTRIHIPENLPLGSEILRFTASDEDGDYSLSGYIIYGLQALRSENVIANSDSKNNDLDIHQAFMFRLSLNTDGDLTQNTVSLVVADYLDRERISSYSLLLHACDLGVPQLCSFSPLHIFIDDLDDNVPEFLLPTSSSALMKEIGENFGSSFVYSTGKFVPGVFYVMENTIVNTVLGQVKAIDRDVTSEIRYSLSSYQDMFEVCLL